MNRSERTLQLENALYLHQPELCLERIREIEEMDDRTAIPTLCALLRRGHRFRDRRFRSPAWSNVRSAAAQTLGTFQEEQTLSALTGALLDKNETVRHSAREALLRFGSQAMVPLTETLIQVRNWDKRAMKELLATLADAGDKAAGPLYARVLLQEFPRMPSRLSRNFFLLPFLGCVGLFWALAFIGFGYAGTGELNLLLLLGSGLIGLFAGAYVWALLAMFLLAPTFAAAQSNLRNELGLTALDGLERIRDKQSLPYVVPIAFGANRKLRARAVKALLELLPMVSEEDYGLLSSRAMQQLTHGAVNGEPPLTLAIIRALEFIGSGSTCPSVRWLVQNGATLDIRLESERILPVLERRLEQEKQATNLLRPAFAPQVPNNQLLRPAFKVDETPPEQLLRPGSEPPP